MNIERVRSNSPQGSEIVDAGELDTRSVSVPISLKSLSNNGACEVPSKGRSSE